MRLLSRRGETVQITRLLDYEFFNAVHAAEFTRAINKGAAQAALKRYDMDFREEVLELNTLELDASLELAKELTRKYTHTFGYRAFDVLHVATALLLDAELFLTFDRLQQKLALAEGLKSPW